jgi:hypothetical protein
MRGQGVVASKRIDQPLIREASSEQSLFIAAHFARIFLRLIFEFSKGTRILPA